LDYRASAGDTAKSGIGRLVTSTYVVAFEYIHTNVGDLSQDVKVNRPPMPDSGVGAIIVVGGWESQPHGEGWQEGDARQGEINRKCPVKSGLPSGVAMKSQFDDKTRLDLEEECRSLESPLQGNLHGGFGGGSGETGL
jgi:hypothetical protein